MTDTQSLYDKAIEARHTTRLSKTKNFLKDQNYQIIEEGEFIFEVVPPEEFSMGTYKSELDDNGHPIDEYQILFDAVDDFIDRLKKIIDKLENNLG